MIIGKSIACSADGARLAAVTYGDGIYVSTNSGGSWAQSSMTTGFWYSVACSFDGTRMAAVDGDGIFISTDGGLTWTQSSAPAASWQSIASSADGTQLAAVIHNGGIYTSTNSGLTWTPSSAPTTHSWPGIASSADGLRLAAVEYLGVLYTSTDGGLTWNHGSFATTWQSIASSADGTRLVAGQKHGGIFISTGSASNLLPGTLYHYQLVGISHAGTTLGADLTFTTLGPPVISSVMRSGTNLISNVTNGAPGGGWTLLTATNLTVPARWTTDRSGTFDGLGKVTLTNGIIDTEPRRFFTIRAQ